jgi:cell division protein FtsL
MNLLQWFGRHSSLTLLLAYIPLIGTVVTTVLSLVLARATLRYAAASDKSLALAREEFEREWSPELHLKLEQVSGREAKLVVTNLAKISVLLQMVQLRKLSMGVPSLRYFLNEPLVGGTTWTDDLGKRFFDCTGEDYAGVVAASITFYVSGRMFRTDWFRFRTEVADGRILKIHPVSIAARRVRVLETHNGNGKKRREFVMDVVPAAAGNGKPER